MDTATDRFSQQGAATATEGATMGWRSTPLVRWIGWTLAFGFLFASILVSLFSPVPNMWVLSLMLFGVTLWAAYAIGVRFPSPSWVAGSPVAILAAVLAIGTLGPMTLRGTFLLTLVFGGWVLLMV